MGTVVAGDVLRDLGAGGIQHLEIHVGAILIAGALKHVGFARLKADSLAIALAFKTNRLDRFVAE